MHTSNDLIDLNGISVSSWPIVIVANYRTGSTVLAKFLGKKYDVPVFLEPWQRVRDRQSNYGKNVNGLQQHFHDTYHSGNKKYVLKIMPDQISRFAPYLEILHGDCHKIKLIRENVVDNILSAYVLNLTNRPTMVPDFKIEPYSLPIDTCKVQASIYLITHVNFLLESLDFGYDQTITYESLGIIDSSDCAKIQMPTNVNEIRQEIQRVYNELY